MTIFAVIAVLPSATFWRLMHDLSNNLLESSASGYEPDHEADESTNDETGGYARRSCRIVAAGISNAVNYYTSTTLCGNSIDSITPLSSRT